MTTDIECVVVDGARAAGHVDEMAALYTEVYAEPPYEWGAEHTDLFTERFDVQRRQDGFTLVEARAGGRLIGMSFGVTLLPDTPWWDNVITPVASSVTDERPNRTFALVELVVRAPWRRRHVARTMHDRVLGRRSEERATLTVAPAAQAAQAAYRAWGWRQVAQTRNPLPGAPVFDVLVKQLD